MLITEEYKEQNKQLHSTGAYGLSGEKHVEAVRRIAGECRDILDYGCGQRTLEKALGFPIHNYDPCIPGLDSPPEPAEFVVCTDVLEHIEPDCLDEVLDDLKRVTKKVGYLNISTCPARKFLPDGRNAHLIQAGTRWWLPKLCQRFEILYVSAGANNFTVMVKGL